MACRLVLRQLPRAEARGFLFLIFQVLRPKTARLDPCRLFRAYVVVVPLSRFGIDRRFIVFSDELSNEFHCPTRAVHALQHPCRLVLCHVLGKHPGCSFGACAPRVHANAPGYGQIFRTEQMGLFPRDPARIGIKVVAFFRRLVLEFLPRTFDHLHDVAPCNFRAPCALQHARRLFSRVHPADRVLEVGHLLSQPLVGARRHRDILNAIGRCRVNVVEFAARIGRELEQRPNLLHTALDVRAHHFCDPLRVWVLRFADGHPVVLDTVPRVGHIEAFVTAVPVGRRVVLDARVALALGARARAPQTECAPPRLSTLLVLGIFSHGRVDGDCVQIGVAYVGRLHFTHGFARGRRDGRDVPRLGRRLHA